jgi:exonuclease III
MDIELNPGPGVESKNLSVAHMNVCSLYMSSIKHNPRVKIDEIISTLVVDKDVDILCISESWLHDQIKDKDIEIPGYQTPLRKDRKDKRGGGVCVYVTDNLTCKQLTEHEPDDTDLLWVELRLQNKRVVVGTCYRPPGQNKAEADHFIDQLGTSLANVIATNPESIILVGDFNDKCVKWDSIHTHSEVKNNLYDLVNIFDLVQLIDEPTYFRDASAHVLDLIITDSPGYVQTVGLLPPPWF